MDYFTKWSEAYLILDQETSTIAEVLLQQWVSRCGTPLQIHSDQGTNFTSVEFKRLYKLLGTDKTEITPLHS